MRALYAGPSLNRLMRRLERYRGLDPVASKLDELASRIKPGPVKDALSGTWLGHALHPLLTDIPLGAFLGAHVLDAVRPDDGPQKVLLGFGVLTAAPTAVTGLSDWSDTTNGDRRIGTVHAAANSVGVGFYTLSLLCRMAGLSRSGRKLTLFGGLAVTVGGFLGGYLSLTKGIGVDRARDHTGPRDWAPVLDAGELHEGARRVVRLGDTPVMVLRHEGRLFAMHARCNHLGAPLEDGKIENGIVTCPWHRSEFKLADGGLVRGPARDAQPCYEVREHEGRIEVRKPAELMVDAL